MEGVDRHVDVAGPAYPSRDGGTEEVDTNVTVSQHLKGDFPDAFQGPGAGGRGCRLSHRSEPSTDRETPVTDAVLDPIHRHGVGNPPAGAEVPGAIARPGVALNDDNGRGERHDPALRYFTNLALRVLQYGARY